MRLLFLLKLLTDFALPLTAQEGNHYSVQPGDIILDRIPKEGRYRFDGFRKASVFFINNTVARGKLNYNFLFGEMQFVDQRGDTVSLSKEQLLEKISFEKTVYYYYDADKKLYLEVLKSGDQLTLTRHMILRLIEDDVKSIDGFVSTSSPEFSRVVYDLDNRAHTTTLRKFYESRAQHPMVFRLHEEYYFKDKNRIFWPANKSSLKRIFTDQQQSLSDFLTKEKTDFNKKEDLHKLTSYCNQL